MSEKIDLGVRLQELRAVAKQISEQWCAGSPWQTEFCVHGDGARVTYHVTDARGSTLAMTEAARIDTTHDRSLRSITQHMASFSPDVATALLDVVLAARSVHMADASGTFNDRVLTGRSLGTALRQLATVTGTEVFAPSSSVEPLRRFWVRWYGPFRRIREDGREDEGSFRTTMPWWQTGWEMSSNGDRPVLVAAVRALSAAHAKALVMEAYARGGDEATVTCVDEKPDDWAPFCERFPRADWMEWPTPAKKGT